MTKTNCNFITPMNSVQYLKHLPPFLASKVACELILNPAPGMVCTKMPMGCKATSTFLVDTSCLANPQDIKADDNGKFCHNGKKVEFLEVDDAGEVWQLSKKPRTLKGGQYKLYRTYWMHSNNSDFKRRLTELEDHNGDRSPVVILQYQFSGEPTDIVVEPHKNAKKAPKPFYVTAKSTRDKISQKVQTALGPSSIYDELYEDSGGVLNNTASCVQFHEVFHKSNMSELSFENSTARMNWQKL